MMLIPADTHIHSALSPCGCDDMTPNNIVNMALLNGLRVIALTDHNTTLNCYPLSLCAAKAGLRFIPGMELETNEEFHMICLFRDLESASRMQDIIWERMVSIHNRKDLFGSQLVFDENDNIICEVERYLLAPVQMDVYEAVRTVKGLDGIIYPAHADRASYSILSNLGMIPGDLDINYVEITKSRAYSSALPDKYTRIYSSDAHDLGQILHAEECRQGFPIELYRQFFKE
jgi:3',5'-nucleoside bisphosphate phosphatase